MYRSMNGSLFGLGATGSMVRCLYYPDGSPVISAEARDAARYGYGGSAGVAKVCYRAPFNSPTPSRVPAGTASRYCARDVTGIYSLYDIYNAAVCFVPVAKSAPVAVPAAPLPSGCADSDRSAFLKQVARHNAQAALTMGRWEPALLCGIMRVFASDGIIEAVHNKPCQAAAVSAYFSEIVAFAEAVKVQGPTREDPSINTAAVLLSILDPVKSHLATGDLSAAVNAYVFRRISASDEYRAQMQTFLINEAKIVASCFAAPATATTAPAVPSETSPAPVTSPSLPAAPEDPTPIDADQSWREAYVNPPPDGMLLSPGPEEPKKSLDTKTLVIGGIIAALAVGGIAVAVSMRKK
jgi:hypothetical protein